MQRLLRYPFVSDPVSSIVIYVQHNTNPLDLKDIQIHISISIQLKDKVSCKSAIQSQANERSALIGTQKWCP